LVFAGDEPVEIILIKPLALPATAPFGVSDGNFAIGEAPESTCERTLSRSRILDRLRRDEDKGRTRREEESALGKRKNVVEEPDPRQAQAGRGQGTDSPGRGVGLRE